MFPMRRRFGRPGLVGKMARTAVVAGTATAVSGSMQRRAATKGQAAYEGQQASLQSQAELAGLQQQVSSLQAQAQPAQTAVPATGTMSPVITELERLAALHSSGALTDQEFAAAKARLLG